MKLDFPRYTERLGAVSIHGVQRIYELDSGKSKGFLTSHQTIKKFDYDEISNILHDMAIVVPVKDEKLKLLEGVLSGIPNECLVIITSNSPRTPVDRFTMEAETVRQLGRFMDKRIVVVYQRDPALGDIFKKLGYDSILAPDGNVRSGKAEGMVIGMLIAKMYQKDYVGFIDSDNYVPGAVNEYVKIFAAGFGMAATPYSNIRVSWVFKPKVRNNSLQFSKWGRVSEVTNKNLNSMLSGITGFETEVIKTGNSGEHALSMPLAESLHYSSGYSIEPYEFVDIFEKFGGLLPSNYPNAIEKGVEIFQIETRNPHFHEDKGKTHLNEMLEAALATIAGSRICPPDLKEGLDDQIAHMSGATKGHKKPDYRKKFPVMEPISTIPIEEFAKNLREKVETFFRYGGLK
ncbi:MAG TPA: mannosyl-3-phosphoglycerate synthase [Nitrososphaera sp.]|jgi:mannosyl-3-phosphoglycerate synthase|nr:mannosyl-3-phosphoglycerate synthase [uncultured Nitrososphaera sp.]HEU4984189.1 mannosyl-3-phosphoglycerate synthase [Nitrososphaera sp.]HZT35913.1 mannosyl-3-phosphoglycerate synthase [Nitrososphaera sp.]